MENFEYKSLKQLNKMSLGEIKEYYQSLLSYELARGTFNREDITNRQRFYFFVRLLLKIDRILSHRTLRIVKDARYHTSKPRLYVVNGTTGNMDVPTMIEAVGEPAWLAEPCKGYFTDLDCYLFRKGIISWYNPDYPEQTKSVDNRAQNIISHGGNEIVIEPTPEDGMRHIIGEVVVNSSPVIIPTAMRLYKENNHTSYYINFGRNLELNGLDKKYIPEILTIISDDIGRLGAEIEEKHENETCKKEGQKLIIHR